MSGLKEGGSRILSDAEWRARLTSDQYEVARRGGTERAFTGPYWDEKRLGRYDCVCCGTALFSSAAKYDSGTGWPSFWRPISVGVIEEREDSSMMMRRIEVVCRGCGAHLGHVFGDGPAPTGLRYCVNGHALSFVVGEDGED